MRTPAAERLLDNILNKIRPYVKGLNLSKDQIDEAAIVTLAGMGREYGVLSAELERALGLSSTEAEKLWHDVEQAAAFARSSNLCWVDMDNRQILAETEDGYSMPVIHVAKSFEIAERVWIPSSIKGSLTPIPLDNLARSVRQNGHKLMLYGSQAWIDRLVGIMPDLIAKSYPIDITTISKGAEAPECQSILKFIRMGEWN